MFFDGAKGFAFWGLLGVVAITVFIIFIVVVPFLLIWALNQLFGLSIQFTFWNWLAAAVLLMLLKIGGVTHVVSKR